MLKRVKEGERKAAGSSIARDFFGVGGRGGCCCAGGAAEEGGAGDVSRGFMTVILNVSVARPMKPSTLMAQGNPIRGCRR